METFDVQHKVPRVARDDSPEKGHDGLETLEQLKKCWPTKQLGFQALPAYSSSKIGTHSAHVAPSNYHSNLLALTTLPTIKRYELPSTLILSG
jgi:hypothetical protein